MDTFTKDLCTFLQESHSPYHARAALCRQLEAAGYELLEEGARWSLAPGGKYCVCRGGAAVIAFRLPRSTPRGFLMAAAHTDRPSLKLKENGETVGAYVSQQVERYGGLLAAPWLDRPLSIAGRVLVETGDGAQVRLIDIDRDLMLIPNVAIHMNRQANDGYKWNPVTDLNPLLGGKGAAGRLSALLEEQAGGKILAHDLTLYLRQEPRVWGIDGEYISAQGLDDLQCVFGCLRGFLEGDTGESVPVLCALNSEEIGSCTPGGAGATFLEDVLARIAQGLGADLRQLLSRSFLVSADNAHAIHPNHPELADGNNAPVMGQGIVVKFNANQRYCTDAVSAALFRRICGRAGVSTQTYYNRPDIPGGSTLGCISIAHVSVPTVDIGLPQLAMHSCYETAAVSDGIALRDAMKVYFQSTLDITEAGFTLS